MKQDRPNRVSLSYKVKIYNIRFPLYQNEILLFSVSKLKDHFKYYYLKQVINRKNSKKLVNSALKLNIRLADVLVH